MAPAGAAKGHAHQSARRDHADTPDSSADNIGVRMAADPRIPNPVR